jgi:hypothetical protein
MEMPGNRKIKKEKIIKKHEIIENALNCFIMSPPSI